MAWEKVPKELDETLARLVEGFPCQKKPMFGCPVYFVNDQMWTGVKADMVFLRLSETDRREIMAECDEVVPFQPRDNMVMKEYVTLPEDKLSNPEYMDRWLHRSFEYTAALPPKKVSPRKSGKKT